MNVHVRHIYQSQSRPIVYMNEHGVAPQYQQFVQELFAELGGELLHSYMLMPNRELPEDAGESCDARSLLLFPFLLVWRRG
jgi:hypothetical protein